MNAPTSNALHKYAIATAIATFLLVLAGSLVTSTDSGLAVPDWPLSYGTWMPPMVGGILYEHGHRMIAGLVALMILGLAIWTARVESRRWVKRLALGALGAVCLQALLGGLTVLWLLPPQVSIAHACLGQAIFCLVTALAWCTTPGWSEAATGVGGGSRSLAVLGPMTAISAAVQLLLGAVIRHTGYAVFAHALSALVLLALAAGLAQQAAHAPVLQSHARRLLALVVLQLGLGLAVFTHRTALALRTAHVGFGALILAQAVIVAWAARRSAARGRVARAVPTGAAG